MGKRWGVFCCLFFMMSAFTPAWGKSIFTTLRENFDETWLSKNYEVIIPVNTWHSRLTYTKEEYDEYNEVPWGLGFDKYRIDQYGNTHQIYAIIFADSHYKAEPSVGYTWQKNWYLDNKRSFAVGLGYNIMVTARHEYYYIPFPSILPLAGISYKRASIQINYVPYLGSFGGDVFFTIFKWQL